MTRLYYTAPSDELFEENKAACIQVWKEVSRDRFYMEEKVKSVEKMTNIGDNFMTMVAFFDQKNQFRLADKLSPECRTAIRERMIDGGHPDYLIEF